MNDSQFHQLANQILEHIEEVIESTEGEIDYESQGGVLNLYFENDTQMVLNKQEPLHQIWLATRFDGHHFELRGDQWIDNRSGVELYSFLGEIIKKQADIELEF